MEVDKKSAVIVSTGLKEPWGCQLEGLARKAHTGISLRKSVSGEDSETGKGINQPKTMRKASQTEARQFF